VWGSPAQTAGLNAVTTVLSVNGLAYKAERLKAAIAAAKDGKSPIELIVRDGEHFKTVRVAYTGGLRYPKLERIEGAADRLTAILSAL
jgi:predicted metalloprotease with PDZ domain